MNNHSCSTIPLPEKCDDEIFANMYIDEQVKKYKLSSATQPYFIIAWGPPASGKGACRDQYLADLRIKKYGAMDILVDDLIAMVKEYNTGMKECGQGCDSTNIYFKYRTKGNKIRDYVLEEALDNKYNIIWETTGKDINRLNEMKPMILNKGYKIVVVYPYVNIDKILYRNEERAKLIGRKPQDALIKKIFTDAQTNLVNLIAPDPDYYKIILYDNDMSQFCSKILVDETKGQPIICDKNWKLVVKETDSPNLYKWVMQKCK
jgi:hypothetical protein